jgi:hypothetical protein
MIEMNLVEISTDIAAEVENSEPDKRRRRRRRRRRRFVVTRPGATYGKIK